MYLVVVFLASVHRDNGIDVLPINKELNWDNDWERACGIIDQYLYGVNSMAEVLITHTFSSLRKVFDWKKGFT